MDKKKFNLLSFVYKIIRTILFIPIKMIKYLCVGFYFTCKVLIELMIYVVVFTSFLFYKLLKYLVLFFAFPVVIYNLVKTSSINKKSKKLLLDNIDSEEVIVLEEPVETFESENIILPEGPIEIFENENVVVPGDENIFAINNELMNDDVEAIQDGTFAIEPEIIDSAVNSDTLIDTAEIEDIADKSISYESIPSDEIIVNKIKSKKKVDYFKVFKLFWSGIQWVSYFVYKIFKYFFFGIAESALLIYKGFVFASFGLYKIVKYLFLSLTLPIMIYNMIYISNKDKIELRRKQKEELRLKREEEKFKKQLSVQKLREEKLRKDIKKKQQQEYINENVEIEKKSFKEKINDGLNKFFNLPVIITEKIKKAFQNSVFVKDYKNKQDINRQALLIDFEGEEAEKSDVKLVYQYTAKNKEGKMVTDYLEAFSKVEVHSYLLSEGYEVYSIKTNKWIQFSHKGDANSRVKIKNKDLIFFLTQLSTYIKAGIPLVDSLKILTRQYSKNKSYQKLFSSIIYDLTMGDNFSTALSKQGDAFPRILINMVKASEMTGELPEVLDDMADYFTEMEKTRKQMVTALMYPLLIMVVSIAVVVFILLFVIPKFVDIYESMDASKIPAFTLAVLAVSDFLKHYSIHLLIGLVVIIVIFGYLYKHIKVFRTLCQWILMHIPVVSNVIIYNEVTTFTKTFASLLSHNVFITDSMEILTKVTNNEIYRMLILDTITNLAKGEKISTSFKDHWAFPIPAYEMLVTGEQTGQLPEMMAKVADYYQDLHKNSVARIKTFLEPALIIFLTVVVGLIVLSIIIPMFGMYQTVQNYS